MRTQDKLRLRLRSLFSRRNMDRDLEAELRSHLDQLVEEDVAAGLAPDEAHRVALLKMAGLHSFRRSAAI